MPNFAPIGATCRPCMRGEKPQNRSLSKLNTGRLALRAMLLVNSDMENVICNQCGERLAIFNTENIKICG